MGREVPVVSIGDQDQKNEYHMFFILFLRLIIDVTQADAEMEGSLKWIISGSEHSCQGLEVSPLWVRGTDIRGVWPTTDVQRTGRVIFLGRLPIPKSRSISSLTNPKGKFMFITVRGQCSINKRLTKEKGNWHRRSNTLSNKIRATYAFSRNASLDMFWANRFDAKLKTSFVHSWKT